jgi:hypothetical protein
MLEPVLRYLGPNVRSVIHEGGDSKSPHNPSNQPSDHQPGVAGSTPGATAWSPGLEGNMLSDEEAQPNMVGNEPSVPSTSAL